MPLSQLQAMFHMPKTFLDHLSNFIPFEECASMIDEILRKTAFPNQHLNPFFLLCVLLSFSSFGVVAFGMWNHNLGFMNIGMFLPIIIYFGLMKYKKAERQNSLIIPINMNFLSLNLRNFQIPA